MARSDPQINIRISADLKEQLEDAAKASGRSLNAEIIARLDATFPSGVEDAIRTSRQSELQKLRASYRLALSDLENYRSRLQSGDTGPYGEEWIREVLLQAEYRVGRLEKMILRIERELLELRKDDIRPQPGNRDLVAEFEDKAKRARRDLADLKSLLPDASPKDRAAGEREIATIEAAITKFEQSVSEIKARAAAQDAPKSAATARRRAVEKDS